MSNSVQPKKKHDLNYFRKRCLTRFRIRLWVVTTQPAFTCSKLTIEMFLLLLWTYFHTLFSYFFCYLWAGKWRLGMLFYVLDHFTIEGVVRRLKALYEQLTSWRKSSPIQKASSQIPKDFHKFGKTANQLTVQICSANQSTGFYMMWRRSGVFIVHFERISHLTSCSSVSIVNFEHVIAGWVHSHFSQEKPHFTNF